MKLITSFFSSSSSSNNKSSSNKSKSKKSKGRSMNRSDTPSFGSSTTTSSNDSFSRATVRTPTTVFLGRNASALDAEYWSSTSADFASKAAGVGGSSSVVSSAVSSAVSDLFCVFDRDGDGKITKQELEVVLRRLRRSDPPTEEEVVMMMAEVDRDGDGCISLEEFGVLGTALVDPSAAAAGGGGVAEAAAAGAAVEEELRDAFGVFDEDGDGKISAEELLQVFLALGDERCTLEECRRMIGGVDSDGDGYVCFDDFVRMMDGQRL